MYKNSHLNVILLVCTLWISSEDGSTVTHQVETVKVTNEFLIPKWQKIRECLLKAEMDNYFEPNVRDSVILNPSILKTN